MTKDEEMEIHTTRERNSTESHISKAIGAEVLNGLRGNISPTMLQSSMSGGSVENAHMQHLSNDVKRNAVPPTVSDEVIRSGKYICTY